MKAQSFEAGQTVYTIDGHQCEYVAKTAHGHIALPLYEGNDPDDGSPWGDTGSPVTVAAVFAEPPRPRLAEEIAEAQAQLSALIGQVSEREAQLRELQRGDRERLARLKEHRQLARIDDWMAGKVTHLVMWEYCGTRVEVKTWDEVMKQSENRRDAMPLLVLNGTLEWVDDYARMGIDWCIVHKNSSTTQRVIPCCSEAEARERAIEAVKKLGTLTMRNRRNRGGGYDHEIEQIVTSMHKLGVEPDTEMVAAYEESRRAAVSTSLTVARRDHASATQKLQEAEAAAQAAGVT